MWWASPARMRVLSLWRYAGLDKKSLKNSTTHWGGSCSPLTRVRFFERPLLELMASLSANAGSSAHVSNSTLRRKEEGDGFCEERTREPLKMPLAFARVVLG